MFLYYLRKTQHEKKKHLPVIRSQKEPISPILNVQLPRTAQTSGLLHSHSGPAAASGTGPIWVEKSSGLGLDL